MDPIAFPVLAGVLLNEAIKFLFDRASSVLDRRAGRIPVEQPEEVVGQEKPLQVHAESLTDERAERISQARGALAVYLSRPELLRGDDNALRSLLGEIRQDLEEVYACRFTFGDQESPQPGVNIIQRAEIVDNKQIGARAHSIGDSINLGIIQNANLISDTGEQVGLEIDGPIG